MGENVGNTAMLTIAAVHVMLVTHRLVAVVMLSKTITVEPSTKQYLVDNVRGGTVNRLMDTHARFKTILVKVLSRTIAAIPMEKMMVHGVTLLILENVGNTAMSPFVVDHSYSEVVGVSRSCVKRNNNSQFIKRVSFNININYMQ